MPEYTGSCYCSAIKYTVNIDSTDDARTSLCHCLNCKKFTGGPFGITTKLPASSFSYSPTSQAHVKSHDADNGGGVILHREFCDECGTGMLEYGEAMKGKNVYVFYGTFDEKGRKELGPKGEFFTRKREGWMPQVPGTFQKKEIKD